jgi:hypothetical protein
LNWSAVHAWHAPPLEAPQPARYVPAPHVAHDVQLDWPLAVAHGEHWAAQLLPLPALKEPVLHGVHSPALEPLQPVR